MIVRITGLPSLLLAIGCAVTTGASCSGGSSATRDEASNQASNQASNDVNEPLLQLSAHPTLEILVRTGTQHWAAGEITLLVNGKGTVHVIQLRASSTTSFDGTLTQAELDAFGRALHAHRFTAPRTSSLPREPGDTPATLTLRRDAKVVFAAELWSAHRDDDPDLDAILRAADQLIHRVSAGKLGQP